MKNFYSEPQRTLQRQFGTEELAQALTRTVSTELQQFDREFIETRDMFFLATVDAAGMPTCSYKGGDSGFVRVIDPRVIAFPSYDGNGMFLSLGNVKSTGKVGLLFIDFETPHRLRVQGTASIDRDDRLLQEYTGAQLIVRIAVESIFVNCPRYVHRYKRIEASKYVPRTGREAPFPQWKRVDVLQPALPQSDSGKTEAAGGPISMWQYLHKLSIGDG
jgi:predicted pyridoxine 5'-phosphate oxidase superfamily flavin-nucleotide-binding protein